jgi:hypothetical protein
MDILTIWLGIWLVCGIGGALISQSKNRSPWIGGLVGFCFAFVGVFILACLSKKQVQA